MNTLQAIVLPITIGYLGLCIWVGARTKGRVRNYSDYFIGGKAVTFWYLFFTVWASFNGAGNFVGYAGRALLHGISAFWVALGEVILGYNIFAFVIAPILAKHKYYSAPHYLSFELSDRDLFVRRIAGIANLLPNICWVGGQIMAIAYIFTMVFNVDYRLVAIVVGAIVIFYTVSGGFKAVVQTDFFQGILQLLMSLSVIALIIKVTHLDVSFVKQQLITRDPTLWQWTPGGILPHISAFLVGLLGGISNPPQWNRAFSAKDVKTIRAYQIAEVYAAINILFILFMGLYVGAIHPEAGDKATYWFIFNYAPTWLQALVVVCVMAACMSTADTHLNNGVANLMADIIDPAEKLPPEKQVLYSRIGTLLCGIFSIGAALTFPTILDLGMFGYAICGGVLVPYFVIAYYYKKTHNSCLPKLARRAGILLGLIVAVLFEGVPSLSKLLGGGIIPAAVVTTLVTLLLIPFSKES